MTCHSRGDGNPTEGTFMRLLAVFLVAACAALPTRAQDAKAWLEKEGLESVDTKTFNEFEIVVAKPTGGGEQRAAIIAKGKPLWQSSTKDADPGSKWTIVSVGRDLAGTGPDVHFSVNTGGGNCCTTHYIYQLGPKVSVKRLAAYAAGSMGGGDFIEIKDRKQPVMVSAD